MKVSYFLVLAVVARQIFQMYKMERTMLMARDAFIEWRTENPGVYVGLSDTGCRLLTELIVAYDRFVNAHTFWCNESYREYYANLFNDVPPNSPKDMPTTHWAPSNRCLSFCGYISHVYLLDMQQFKIRCRGVILHDEKLLLVKNSHGGTFYALPGGHLDFGEDPKECMYRELVEELGVEPVVGRLLYVYTFVNSESIQSVEFFFEIENGSDYLNHEEKEKTHAFELAEVIWADPSDQIQILPSVIGQAFREGILLDEHVRFIKA